MCSQDGTTELWSGSYISFMWFRQTLARICANCVFDPYLSGHKYAPVAKELISRLTETPKWKPKTEQILKGFLAFFPHSDCDGKWTSEECQSVSHLLTFCKENLKEHSQSNSQIYKTVFVTQFASETSSVSSQASFEDTIDTLLEGLQYCIANKQEAEFS